MQKVKITVIHGVWTIDFQGYPGDGCKEEETKIRAFAQMMGVETNVRYSEARETEPEFTVEQEKEGA